MIVIAKNHYDNTGECDTWEFEFPAMCWSEFIEDAKSYNMIADYFNFVEVDKNGILIFISKYADEEWGMVTRTYQLKC